MQWFFLVIIVLCLLFLLSGPVVRADPKVLARSLRIAGGLAALATAALLAFTGRTGFALPLAGLGIMLMGRGVGTIAGFGFPGGNADKSAGQVSTVRTAWLEMTLDHDSGDMGGRFSAGAFSGQAFSELDKTELVAAYEEFLAVDSQSAQLLEAYLDHQFEDWRSENHGASGTGDRQDTGTGGAAGPMSMAEAFEILGLSFGAGEPDIRAAHRRLMKKLHPDQGGSTVLASKVNQAKDVALGGRS